MQSGTIQNRDSFLNNIANQLGRERKKTIERPEWKYNPQLDVFDGATQDELMEILKKQCNNIHTTYRETTTAELAKVLEEVVTTYEGKTIVTSNDPRFEEFGLTNYLNGSQQTEKRIHVWDPAVGSDNIEFSKSADVGITFSDITLAESGTVGVYSSPKNGRSISLLPATYIAIVPKSTIVPRMTQAASSIHNEIQNGEKVASCVNFISGPSNSADIEMVLIVGVHGPIKATYIVVTDK